MVLTSLQGYSNRILLISQLINLLEPRKDSSSHRVGREEFGKRDLRGERDKRFERGKRVVVWGRQLFILSMKT